MQPTRCRSFCSLRPSSFHEKSRTALTVRDLFWGGKWDSNPRQPESQSGTLPTELFPPEFEFYGLPGRDRTCDHLLRRQVLYPTELRADRLGVQQGWNMVGVKRFELPTSCSQSRRATRLRYTPGRKRILHEKRKNATLFFQERALPSLKGTIRAAWQVSDSCETRDVSVRHQLKRYNDA